MSKQATIIRDAVFDRIRVLTPAGSSAWGLVSVTTLPTLNTTMLPALQVSVAPEIMRPDGQAGMGFPHFVAEATIEISVLRGLDDPTVLDGRAVVDLDNFLETLLSDPSFVSENMFFRGVTQIFSDRRLSTQGTEAYLVELILKMTFDYQIGFGPVATVPLDSVAIAVRGYPQPIPGGP